MRDKYYDEIKNNLIDDETYSKVKDYSKEKHRVETYYKNEKYWIRQFYRNFCDKKWSTLSTKLSWSHYTELLPIKNEDEMLYYFIYVLISILMYVV